MRVALGAIVKNEGPYILEWIAHHQAIGITDFFIADNVSDDGTSELLDALDNGGVIVRIPYPTVEGEAPQLGAYRKILADHGGDADWIAFIDADEFLCPVGLRTVPEFIARRVRPDTGAIAINWAVFGSSFLEDFAEGLVTERFYCRAPQEWGVNRHYKLIARPDAVGRIVNPHYFELTEGCRLIAADGNPLKTSNIPGLSKSVCWDGMRINHYVTKSRGEFEKKAARGRATTLSEKRSEKFFPDHDRNDTADPMINWLSRDTRENMSRMAYMLGDWGGWNPHVLERVSITHRSARA